MVVFCSLQCIRHDASPKEEAAPDGWLGVAGGREGPSHRAPQLAPWATRALAGARVINSTELQRFPKGGQSAQARIDSGVSGTFARRGPWKFRARILTGDAPQPAPPGPCRDPRGVECRGGAVDDAIAAPGHVVERATAPAAYWH